MAPPPARLFVPVGAASYNGLYEGRWPAGDKPDSSARFSTDFSSYTVGQPPNGQGGNGFSFLSSVNTAVQNAIAPLTGRALQFNFPADPSQNGSLSEQYFTMEPTNSAWFNFKLRMPTAFGSAGGQAKLLFVWNYNPADPNGNYGYFTMGGAVSMWTTSATTASIDFAVKNYNALPAIWSGDFSPNERAPFIVAEDMGNVIDIIVGFERNVATQVSRCRVWKDDALMLDNSLDYNSNPYGLWAGQPGYIPPSQYVDYPYGVGYILGSNDTGLPSTTVMQLGDFVYDTTPIGVS